MEGGGKAAFWQKCDAWWPLYWLKLQFSAHIWLEQIKLFSCRFQFHMQSTVNFSNFFQCNQILSELIPIIWIFLNCLDLFGPIWIYFWMVCILQIYFWFLYIYLDLFEISNLDFLFWILSSKRKMTKFPFQIQILLQILVILI